LHTIQLEARSPFTLRFPWALVSSLRAVALRDLTDASLPTGVYVWTGCSVLQLFTGTLNMVYQRCSSN